MLVEPLPRPLYDQLRNAGVIQLELAFKGGNDEGFLDVSFVFDKGQDADSGVESSLSTAVEKWAWDVYSFSGCGDGTDYGDTITYNFETGKVITQAWEMERVESEPQEHDIPFQEGN